jgi:hypothetical protein
MLSVSRRLIVVLVLAAAAVGVQAVAQDVRADPPKSKLP